MPFFSPIRHTIKSPLNLHFTNNFRPSPTPTCANHFKSLACFTTVLHRVPQTSRRQGSNHHPHCATLMQVTKSNINEAYAEFSRLLPSAKFCSVDLEMTGLYPANQPKNSVADTVEERYKSMTRGSTDFTILQLGLCLTHADPNDPTQYIHTPFNLYTWPSAFKSHPESALPGLSKAIAGGGSAENPNTLFLDLGAIEYNRDHDMDFQKWITEGMPYWKSKQVSQIADFFHNSILYEEHHQKGLVYGENREEFGQPEAIKSIGKDVENQEVVINRQLSTIRSLNWKSALFDLSNLVNAEINEHLKLYDALPPVPVPAVEQVAADNAAAIPSLPQTLTTDELKKIPYINYKCFQDGPISIDLPKIPKNDIFVNTTRAFLEYQLPKDNSYIIRVDTRTIDGDNFNLKPTLTIYTPQQHLLRVHNKKQRFDELKEGTLGASLFWEALKGQKLPLIVHNGMFDLLFCYSHMEGNLPPTFTEFRAKLANIFPAIYDTKYIYNHPITQRLIANKVIPEAQGNTALGTLHELFETHAQTAFNSQPKSTATPITHSDDQTDTKNPSTSVPESESESNSSQSPQFSITPLRPAQLRDKFRDYAPNSTNPRYHEAGFDAYVTSAVFAQLFHHITTFHKKYKPHFTQHHSTELNAALLNLETTRPAFSEDNNLTDQQREQNYMKQSEIRQLTSTPTLLHSHTNLQQANRTSKQQQDDKLDADSIHLFNALFRSIINTMNSLYHFNLALPINSIETRIDAEIAKQTDPSTSKSSSTQQHKCQKSKNELMASALLSESSKLSKYATWFDLKHDLYQPNDPSNIFILINTAEELHLQKHHLQMASSASWRDSKIYLRPAASQLEQIFNTAQHFSRTTPIYTPLNPSKEQTSEEDKDGNISSGDEKSGDNGKSKAKAERVKFKIGQLNSSVFSIQCTPPVQYHELLRVFKSNANNVFPHHTSSPLNQNSTKSTLQPHVYVDVAEWDIIPLHIYLQQREMEYLGQKSTFFTPYITPQHEFQNHITNGSEKSERTASFMNQLTALKSLSAGLFKQQCSLNGLLVLPGSKKDSSVPQIDSNPTKTLVHVQHETYTMRDLEQLTQALAQISLLPSHTRKALRETNLKQLAESTILERIHQFKHGQLSNKQRQNKEKQEDSGVGASVSKMLKSAGDTWVKHRPFIMGTLLGAGTTAASMYGIYQGSMGKIHTQAVADMKYHHHPYFTQHTSTTDEIQQYHTRERQALAKRRLLAKKQAEKYNQQKKAQLAHSSRQPKPFPHPIAGKPDRAFRDGH